MMWGNGDWWQLGMGFGLHWVFGIAFWLLLIWGVVSLHRLATGGRAASANGPEGSALEILKTRYARGEMNRQEYRAMRKELEA